jgi:Zn-dependent membrane protease YugP
VYWGMFNDPTWLLIIPGLLLAWYAQARVNSTFQKYSQIQSYGGMTASVAARRMLDMSGLMEVPVNLMQGRLTDNYNPKTRTLNLSQSVHGSASLAALGVAAHEAGHAVQHSEHFAPMAIRGALVPVANIGSYAAFPLLILGLLLSFQPLVWVGVGVFGFAVLFQLVTLPVEYDASRRGLEMLRDGGFLAEEEVAGARKVLSAAALTYMAATLVAVLQFLRFFLIASGGRRRS